MVLELFFSPTLRVKSKRSGFRVPLPDGSDVRLEQGQGSTLNVDKLSGGRPSKSFFSPQMNLLLYPQSS